MPFCGPLGSRSSDLRHRSECSGPRADSMIAVMIDRLVLGGVEKTAIEEVRALREVGVDATLLVLKRDESIPAAVREWLSGVPVEYLDERLPRFLRTSWRVPGFYFFSIFHGLYALLLPTRIQPREWDVILSHNSYTTFTAWTLSRLRGIPYCMFVWDPIASVLVRAYPKGGIRFLQPLLLPLGRAVDRVLARGADGESGRRRRVFRDAQCRAWIRDACARGGGAGLHFRLPTSGRGDFPFSGRGGGLLLR